jgi:precorrin-3B C17-methyltransferase
LTELTPRANNAIREADAVVGYDTYLALIAELIGDKAVVGTGMMQEIDRCQAAVDLAVPGKTVAVVSSGDPGIYGMAGLVLELAMKLAADSRPEVEVIPGISAVGAAAAVLGAPLMHDFAVISLSDLLTPWVLIQKRAEMAAIGDFVIALYNPRSTKRVQQIERVREILLQHRSAATPVGIVRQASRNGQQAVISDLENFTKEAIDMFSLVIIGNSQTYVKDGRMITPRGYQL